MRFFNSPSNDLRTERSVPMLACIIRLPNCLHGGHFMSKQEDGELRPRVHAIRVHQWLPEWDDFDFDDAQYRARPPSSFYLTALSVHDLRSLTDITQSDDKVGSDRPQQLGRRKRDVRRSEEIREHVSHGFPWSTFSAQRRESGEFKDLKKPGWLPTAIVVNILKSDDVRRGESVFASDLIETRNESGDTVDLMLPARFGDSNWRPSALAPLEVIDGLRRLRALDGKELPQGFSLPVVAFLGLDISWQAYLHYTINFRAPHLCR